MSLLVAGVAWHWTRRSYLDARCLGLWLRRVWCLTVCVWEGRYWRAFFHPQPIIAPARDELPWVLGYLFIPRARRSCHQSFSMYLPIMPVEPWVPGYCSDSGVSLSLHSLVLIDDTRHLLTCRPPLEPLSPPGEPQSPIRVPSSL